MVFTVGEIKKVGIGLVGCGILFTFLAVILFFDGGLLALGNIFTLSGLGLLLGWQSTWQLFTSKMNFKGSIPFFVGLFLIFFRWPVTGIILEIFGSVFLFGFLTSPTNLISLVLVVTVISNVTCCLNFISSRGFWPSVKIFIYQIPLSVLEELEATASLTMWTRLSTKLVAPGTSKAADQWNPRFSY